MKYVKSCLIITMLLGIGYAYHQTPPPECNPAATDSNTDCFACCMTNGSFEGYVIPDGGCLNVLMVDGEVPTSCDGDVIDVLVLVICIHGENC